MTEVLDDALAANKGRVAGFSEKGRGAIVGVVILVIRSVD
jgi:hypothetical protein